MPWICVPICVTTPALAAASVMKRASATLCVRGFSQYTGFFISSAGRVA